MLFCRDCGQCIHINDDYFKEYASVSGTETRYINADTGDIEDYGDCNTEGNGESTYECPHCESSDIDLSWDGTEEEALAIRKKFKEEEKTQKELEKELLYNETTRESEWDLVKNK